MGRSPGRLGRSRAKSPATTAGAAPLRCVPKLLPGVPCPLSGVPVPSRTFIDISYLSWKWDKWDDELREG